MKDSRIYSKERKNKMPPSLRKKNDEMLANGLIDYLCSELGTNNTTLAGMLEVTEKTLVSWRNELVSDLESNTKSSRLMTLYKFVLLAREHEVDKYLILSMLHEPVDPVDPKSGSILSHIIKDPASGLFEVMAPKFIREYLSNEDLKRRVLTLSNRDRDTFLAALEKPPQPNDALKSLFQKGAKK